MSDKIKGSDGIERTLDEWREYIFGKTVLVDGDDLIATKLGHLQSMLLMELLDDEDHTEEFGRVAGEYMTLILRDSIANARTDSGKIENLKTHLEKLSRSVANFGWKKSQGLLVGTEIVAYIDQHESLPDSRKAFYQFIKDRGENKIPNRTVDEYLAWYAIEDICRDNQKG